MAELNRGLTSINIPTEIDETVHEHLPNVTAFKRMINAVSLEGGSIERRESFDTQPASVVVSPPLSPVERVDMLTDEMLLARNKVFKKNPVTQQFEANHDFLKYEVQKEKAISIDFRPLCYDYLVFGDHIYVVTVFVNEPQTFALIGDKIQSVYIFKINKETLELEGFREIESGYGYYESGANEADPIARMQNGGNKGLAIVPLNATHCRVYYSYAPFNYTLQSSDVRYSDLVPSNTTTFYYTIGDLVYFVKRIDSAGNYSLIGIRETTAFGLFCINTVTNTLVGNIHSFAPVNANKPCIVDAINFNNRWIITIGNPNLNLTAAPGRYVHAFSLDNGFTTIQSSPSNYDIATVPHNIIKVGQISVTNGYDFFDQSTFSDNLYYGRFYSNNQGNALYHVEWSRTLNYTRHLQLNESNAFRDTSSEKLLRNLAFCTAEARRYRTLDHKFTLFETSYNEGRINESETREELYRTNFLCAPALRDGASDVLLVNKLSEYSFLFSDNPNEYLLTVTEGTTEFYQVNFEYRTFAERKGTLDVFLKVRKIRIGQNVQVASKATLGSKEVIFCCNGSQVWRSDNDGVRPAHSVFPLPRPQVNILTYISVIGNDQNYHAYTNVPCSNNNFRKTYNHFVTSTTNINRYRRVIFPSGRDVYNVPLDVTFPFWNGSAWQNLTIRFFNGRFEDSPADTATIIFVNVLPIDSPTTIAQKVLSKLFRTKTMLGNVINLGDGEVLFLFNATADNTNVFTGLVIRNPADFNASTASSIGFKTGGTIYFLDGTEVVRQPSMPVNIIISGNPVSFKAFIPYPFFESISNKINYLANNKQINAGNLCLYQTKLNGSTFYQAVTGYGDFDQVFPTMIIVNHRLQKRNVMSINTEQYVGGYAASTNAFIDTSPIAPDTGGIVNDGPCVPNVIKINSLNERFCLVTKDGFIYLSKQATPKSYYTFPTEFIYNFTQQYGQAVDFLQIGDKYVLITTQGIFGVVGSPIGDTLQGGGFATPILLKDFSSDQTLLPSRLNISTGSAALIFGNNEWVFVDSSFNVRPFHQKIKSHFDHGFLECALPPLKFNYYNKKFIIWPLENQLALTEIGFCNLLYSINDDSFLTWAFPQTFRSAYSSVTGDLLLLSTFNFFWKKREPFSTPASMEITPMVIETNWLSFNTMQDLNRIFKILFVGEYLHSPHTINVHIYYNYSQAFSTSYSFTSNDVLFGNYQFQLMPKFQKAEAIKIKMEISPDDNPAFSGRCAKLTGITFDIGVRANAFSLKKEQKW